MPYSALLRFLHLPDDVERILQLHDDSNSSKEQGAYPKTRPVTCAEVAATIYQGLGLDPHSELPGPQNRPIPLVDYGVQPIRELF